MPPEKPILTDVDIADFLRHAPQTPHRDRAVLVDNDETLPKLPPLPEDEPPPR